MGYTTDWPFLKGGKSQATALSRYSRGNFISAGVDGIVNLFEEFFLLEGCGVGLYSLSFYNLSVGSPYARPKKRLRRKRRNLHLPGYTYMFCVRNYIHIHITKEYTCADTYRYPYLHMYG